MTDITIKQLTGKAALVTGGSRGIGAAIVKRFTKEGASVAFTYSTSAKRADQLVAAVEADGGHALAIQADMSDEKAVRLAVIKTVDAFGGIDILVNNAGSFVAAPIEQFPIKDFDRLIAVNLRGVFVATQEAVRYMREGGRIVHIGSCNAVSVPFSGGSVYALTKGALVSFTKGLARDLGPRGITVNNLEPGPVDTEMNPADGPGASGNLQHMALERYGHVDEIASFAAYLASPEASLITGASLLADGGYSA